MINHGYVWVVRAEHRDEHDHRDVIYGVRASKEAAERLATLLNVQAQPAEETREKAEIVGPFFLFRWPS